MLDIYLDTAI